MAQSVARRATGWLSRLNANRSISHTTPNSAQRAFDGPDAGFRIQAQIQHRTESHSRDNRPRRSARRADISHAPRSPARTSSTGGRRSQSDKSRRSERSAGQGGSSERAQGRYAAAIEHFHRALELAPNNLKIRFLLAQTYVAGKRIDDAAKSCREILRIAPEHLDARLQLAVIYRAKGNWTAAYREYRNIIELNQSSAQAADALAAIESQQAVAQMDERARDALSKRRRSRPPIPSLPVAVLRDQVPLGDSGISEARSVNPPADLSGAGVMRSLTRAAWPKVIRG